MYERCELMQGPRTQFCTRGYLPRKSGPTTVEACRTRGGHYTRGSEQDDTLGRMIPMLAQELFRSGAVDGLGDRPTPHVERSVRIGHVTGAPTDHLEPREHV